MLHSTNKFHDVGLVCDNGGYQGYLDKPQSTIDIQDLPVTKKSGNNSITLKELIDQYVQCQEVENSWQEKTTAENQAIFKTLVDIVGNTPVSDINHQVADSYRSTLKSLPPNMNKIPKYHNKSIAQILAAKPSKTLSD